ncbi:MAG TPA: carbonic anhydrase [Hyphomicrobiaceae bacterium]|nr:carbonic anhydrase [Hyphomicrobiaceae bacterium]
MCTRCGTAHINRRHMLRLAGLGVAAAGLSLGGRLASAANSGKAGVSPDEALAALKEGNARYVDNPQVCVADLAKARTDLTTHQEPWAIVVGCSDSRVPPELLFGGLGLGQLFVARNAGNMVDTPTMGTVEYGADPLGASLVVVLGHQACGAVAAACEAVTKNVTSPAPSGRWSSRSFPRPVLSAASPVISSTMPCAKAPSAPPTSWRPRARSCPAL